MTFRFWNVSLQLANPWKIAGSPGAATRPVVVVQLTDLDGITGYGEAAPVSLYGESIASTHDLFSRVDPARLTFKDVAGSMAYLTALAPRQPAAVGALNLALLDGAAKRAGRPLYDFLGLGFREQQHRTSFSIGLDTPAIIRQKTRAAAAYPILKLKLGEAHDRANLAALREAAPAKPVRVDLNGACPTKEAALALLEWLATDGNIQFVEQPLPRTTSDADLAWLKARSPLPLFADESCHTAQDIPRCAEFFHGVNVKLVKAGGISSAHETLVAARQAGLPTMLGCMIETSVLISAAAHLAALADYLDLDGNLLITNDPFQGVTAERGELSFASATEQNGLRVSPRR